MALIYCVEDDESIRELMVYALQRQQYEVVKFTSGTDLFQAMADTLPDMILLDVMLPGDSGLEILQQIRRCPQYDLVMVVMVTAKNAEFDIVQGLDLGADDYICKPFGIMEMIARVSAVLRRRKQGDRRAPVYTCGGIVLDVKRYRVTVDNKEVSLTAKEFELLRYLLLNVDLVVTREQMMESVWGVTQFIASRTVDMHIMSLRQKLGKAGSLIQTIRGVGYKMGADI